MAKERVSLKPIMISGYFGFDNCGDEAILMAMIQEFSKYIPKEQIIVLSQNPHRTKELYQVNSLYRLNPFPMIYAMTRAGIFVSGGGGLLQDVSGRGFSIIYYLSLLFLARLFGIPSVLYAQGIGPIKKLINKKIVRWIVSRIHFISVRDEHSKRLLQDLGLKRKMIHVSADPSFLLKRKEISQEVKMKYQIFGHHHKKKKKINIALVIRVCKEIERDITSTIKQFARIADNLIEKYQANLVFLPFQMQSDLPFMKEILKKMEYSSAICMEENLRPDEMLSFISHFSLIIGMRFHSILFATMSNKPFIAISYDPKVRHYVDSLGIPELIINLDQLTVKNVDNKLKYIEANKKMIQSRLDMKKVQFEKEALSNIQSFYRFMKENA